MVDAVSAFLDLASAPEADLTQRVYNIRAFSPSAAGIRDRVVDVFPDAIISFEPDERRQAIVDSWPADVDDRPARPSNHRAAQRLPRRRAAEHRSGQRERERDDGGHGVDDAHPDGDDEEAGGDRDRLGQPP